MKRSRNKLLDDTCWVYVRLDDKNTHIIGITYDEGFRQREIDTAHPLLLWRKFDDTLSAAGYRMVLKNMSTASLEKVLQEYNKDK